MIQFKDLKTIDELKEGDVVQHKVTGLGYTVVYVNATIAVVTRSLSISNPSEWKILE